MQRRSYSKAFKAQVVQECSLPGNSVASVALSHGSKRLGITPCWQASSCAAAAR
ncbi:transposase [Azotobacter chroococcum]|uniref:transposase n=1 Tax=Azotobacter chroococcum TaxID=353 RepID=UPI0012FD3FC2